MSRFFFFSPASQECFQLESPNSSELCLHAKFEPKLLTTVANSLPSRHGPLLLPLILPEKYPKSVSEGDVDVLEITISNFFSLSPADLFCQDLFKHTIRCFFCTVRAFFHFFLSVSPDFLGKTLPFTTNQPLKHTLYITKTKWRQKKKNNKNNTLQRLYPLCKPHIPTVHTLLSQYNHCPNPSQKKSQKGGKCD